MPRNGSGVYSKPAGTTAVPNTDIESAKYNATIDDIVDDLNAARPRTAGGTGETSVPAARQAFTTYTTKSAGYTAAKTDAGAIHRCSAEITVSLTAATTLGANWTLTIIADGGDVTIDADGTELINGAETLVVADGDATYLICTGSAFVAIVIPSNSRITTLPTGAALPAADIGPIWHADYASVMTWQKFDANSADYEGYASVDIGMPVLDGRSTPRTGYLKRNGASLSKTTHAPLWAWAQHNGNVVALGSWAAGAFVFADNGDGTFKVPDNRAEFERAWDDSRGVDSGRVFGSSQLDQMQRLVGTLDLLAAGSQNGTGALSASGSTVRASGSTSDSGKTINLNTANSPNARVSSTTDGETRVRNVALLACIKF